MGAPAPGAEVRILAPAKINLGLAVLGLRRDGYHELRTLFQTVSLYDRVAVRRTARGVRVECPALPDLGERNLAWQAAALFLRESGVRGGLAVTICKRIPAGGGLGGGSSDAAAVLLAACRLHGLRPGAETLRAWAARLGSDVPFFLAGGAAAGSGRGDVIVPEPPWPGAAEVLIWVPESGLSTAEVYARVRELGLTGREEGLAVLRVRWRSGSLAALGRALFNDLEAAVFPRQPELARGKAQLLAAGARGALMSGSGSCVFGLFPGPAAAERARAHLRGRMPGRLLRARFVPARRHWGVLTR